MADEKVDDFRANHLSSPPCYMSEVDPVYMGLADAGDSFCHCRIRCIIALRPPDENTRQTGEAGKCDGYFSNSQQ